MSENDHRTYELGFILAPTVSEDAVPASVEMLKSVIASGEGVVASEGAPEFIDLSYVIERNAGSLKNKYSQGYFGWIKFDAAPAALDAIRKSLDGAADVIRYILMKTSVENTIVFKKPKVEAKRDNPAVAGDLVPADEMEAQIVSEEILEHEKLPDLAQEALATHAQSESE